MSRAFVNEDGPEGPPPLYGLPPREDPGYPLAAARALLAGANAGDTASAELATHIAISGMQKTPCLIQPAQR